MWAEQAISRREWLKARAPIEKRLTVAKKKRLAALNGTSALAPHISDGAGLRERWQEMSLTRQQQIVAA